MSWTSPKRKRSLCMVNPSCCIFCGRDENNEEIFGKLLTSHKMTVHYFCMLFSSGLCQRGRSEKDGILGFLPKDINKELSRGKKLSCCYCKIKGATVGCVVKSCRSSFHLGCGRDNGSMHQFYGSFSSYCDAHRPRQMVSTSDRLAFYGTANTACSICMCAVEARSSNETLRSPCCRNSWFHRNCIQKLASTAGLYYFKCPLCNNKEVFQEEMLEFGIYIPEQDAAWEMEPNSYQDLLERYSRCDVSTCCCPQGREYNKDDSKWEIILCMWCGSQGCHIECHGLKSHRDEFICKDCKAIEKKGQASGQASVMDQIWTRSKKAIAMGLHPGKSERPSTSTSSPFRRMSHNHNIEDGAGPSCSYQRFSNTSMNNRYTLGRQISVEALRTVSGKNPKQKQKTSTAKIKEELRKEYEKLKEKARNPNAGRESPGSSKSIASSQSSGAGTSENGTTSRNPPRVKNFSESVVRINSEETDDETYVNVDCSDGEQSKTPPNDTARTNSRSHTPRGGNRHSTASRTQSRNSDTARNSHRSRSRNTTPTTNRNSHMSRRNSSTPSSNRRPHNYSVSRTTTSNTSTSSVRSNYKHRHRSSSHTPLRRGRSQSPSHEKQSDVRAGTSRTSRSTPTTPSANHSSANQTPTSNVWLRRLADTEESRLQSASNVELGSLQSLRVCVTPCSVPRGTSVSLRDTDTWRRPSAKKRKRGNPWSKGIIRKSTKTHRHTSSQNDKDLLDPIDESSRNSEMWQDDASTSFNNSSTESSEHGQEEEEMVRSTRSKSKPADLVSLDDFPKTFDRVKTPAKSTSSSTSKRLSTEKRQKRGQGENYDFDSQMEGELTDGKEEDDEYNWIYEPQNSEMAFPADMDEEYSAYSKLVQIQKSNSPPKASTATLPNSPDKPEPPHVPIPEFVDMDSVYLDTAIEFGAGICTSNVVEDEQQQQHEQLSQDHDATKPQDSQASDDVFLLDDDDETISLASAGDEEIIFVRAERPAPSHTHNGLNRQWVTAGQMRSLTHPMNYQSVNMRAMNHQLVNRGPIMIDLTIGTEDSPICLNESTLDDNEDDTCTDNNAEMSTNEPATTTTSTSVPVLSCNGFYGPSYVAIMEKRDGGSPCFSDRNLMQSLYTEVSSTPSWTLPRPASPFNIDNRRNNNKLALKKKRPSDASS